MILLKTLRFKNLLSYGNNWTEIQLDQNPLTVVVGENGAGKSTLLLDSICFVLFGKPFRNIKKTRTPLINTITKKELVVELIFSIGVDEYKVIRGMKPNVFEIYRNTLLIPQDNDYQLQLEVIIGCNEKTFRQIVMLGDRYTPFLSLVPQDRRKFIENLLDLEVFGMMNTLLKKEVSDVCTQISDKEGQKTLLNDRLKIYNDNLNKSLEEKTHLISEYKNKIGELLHSIDTIKSEILIEETNLLSDEEFNKLKQVLDNLKEKDLDYTNKKQECRIRLDQIFRELSFFKSNHICPTCTQTLETDFILHKILELEAKVESFSKADAKLEKLSSENIVLFHEKEIIMNKHNTTKNRIEELKYAEYEIRNNDIIYYEGLIKKEEEKHSIEIHSTVNLLNKELIETNDNLDELYKQKDNHGILSQILKDDGLKAQIINQYIDLINELINKFLIEMDFFCLFYLDSEFNEVIKSRYRDEFAYESFSEGQKLRIDLAILFAWRELAKRRNSISINLLIFDEVLSSALSKSGVHNFIDILKKNKYDDNIFLITHDEKCSELIDNVIEIKMVDGFSTVININDGER